MTSATTHPNSSFLRHDTNDGGKVLYLTIDDAPSSRFIEKIDYLERMRVPGFFFCIGIQIEKHRTEVIDAIERGFHIGNHSYSHRRFSELPLHECLLEIRRCEDLIEEVYDAARVAQPRRLFRFPFGDKGWNRKVHRPKWLSGSVAERAQSKLSIISSQLFSGRIQSHLANGGYSQPQWPSTLSNFYSDSGLLEDRDVYWTFDANDYRFGELEAFGNWLRHGDYQVTLPRGHCRRGLLFGDKECDILLAHDYDANLGHTRRLVEFCLSRGAVFKPLI